MIYKFIKFYKYRLNTFTVQHAILNTEYFILFYFPAVEILDVQYFNFKYIFLQSFALYFLLLIPLLYIHSFIVTVLLWLIQSSFH